MELTPRTLGRLPDDAFGVKTLPEVPAHLLEALKALPDLTGMISDAMDELGIEGAISASILKPTQAAARVVGRAITVLNVRREDTVAEAVKSDQSRLADVEAHNLAERGDVLVLQGVDHISNMGGILAEMAARQGEIGAIVDGAVRDIDHSRSVGYPIWSRSVSPITGKWRIQTVAINTVIHICGVAVCPGDIVAADEVGVCIIPRARLEEVVATAQGIAEREQRRIDAIQRGAPIADVLRSPRPAR